MAEQAFFDKGELIGVLTTQPLDRVLDYRAPEGGCFLGAFVEVPLGPRKVLGVVWGPGRGDYDLSKIRWAFHWFITRMRRCAVAPPMLISAVPRLRGSFPSKSDAVTFAWTRRNVSRRTGN